MSPRRLVLCLDGTWNNTYARRKRSDGHEVLKPSNVLKLARAVLPRDPETDHEQLVYYDIGVGSMARYPGLSNRLLAGVDKALGGARGAGFEVNVEDALGFLVLNHLPGDEVFLFGFSRGAATAQALARFLDWSGGLPAKGDSYYLPLALRAYVASMGREPWDDVLAKINRQRAAESSPFEPIAPFEPIDVELLGLWDTVSALGHRGGFHTGVRPPSCARHARHALAIDEVRYDFRPQVWTGSAAERTLEQRWFAGVHSNVGGGYVDDGLANLAFRWMLDEAEALGLRIDESFAERYRGYAQDRLYRSESLLYRALDWIRLRRGRGRRSLVDLPESSRATLDGSVIWRIQADPAERSSSGKLRHPELRRPYRPDNVLRLLAAQDDLAAYLADLGIDPGPASLPPDVERRLGELR